MRDPFWQSAKVLLHYKKMLAMALFAVALSAAAFGAGLSALLPLFHVLFQQGKSIHQLIADGFIGADHSAFSNNIGQWLTSIVPDDRFWAFVWLMGVIAFLSVFGFIGKYLHLKYTFTIVGHASMRWRRRVFRRLVHAPMAEVLQKGASDRISRFMHDVWVMTNGYRTLLGKSTFAVFQGSAALIAALFINWQLCAVVMVVAFALAVMMRKFGKRIGRASRRAMEVQSKMLGVLTESLSGIRVVKVHDAEGYERRRFVVVNREHYRQELSARNAKALSGPLVEVLAFICIQGVACIVAYLIYRHNYSPEEFMTALIMLVASALSFRPVTALHNEIVESGAAAARVMELLDLPVEPSGADAPKGVPSLPRHRESIVFDKVTYRYRPELEPAVRDVSFSVTSGQTVAIVGSNGSGKTTVLSFLPRLLVPQEGHILIDGHDIMRVSLRSLRKQMAVVTQQTVLFEGTIAQNIAYGRRHEPIERITAAAKAGHAHEFIMQLPGGYDARLGEGGVGLSGGQMQRIAIARAVLRDPAILILDEATSQIDSESEVEITKALGEISKGRTTFIIAHRLSTVVNADNIVVMKAGTVIAQGRHHELLETCDMYKTLVQTQLFNAT